MAVRARARPHAHLHPREYTPMTTMTPLEARVKNGRLVLDEPTDLPEGQTVYLQPTTAPDDEDGFDDEERAALHHALDEGLAAARSGDHVDAEAFVHQLLARR